MVDASIATNGILLLKKGKVRELKLKVLKKVKNLGQIIIATTKKKEDLSLETQEMNIIKKALEKYKGKRSLTAKELGISERTLYRKIKQYDLK